MRPALIVTVTRLVLDVVDDLAAGPDAQMCQSERNSLRRFYWQRDHLQEIHDHAVKDMNGLVPANLDI